MDITSVVGKDSLKSKADIEDSTKSKDTQSTDERSANDPNQKVIEYLLARVPEFRDLAQARDLASKSHEANTYFAKMRNRAAAPAGGHYFFELMQHIATEMQAYTGAMKISVGECAGSGEAKSSGRILDLCMAPGGFLATAMRLNPGSEAVAFSLPVSKGGHDVLLESVETTFLDTTMLAADIMGVSGLSAATKGVLALHPDHENFITETQLGPDDVFDLVLCDGQVLRHHERASYREDMRRESIRLLVSQLSIGLQHLTPGGTMVVLLHKVEAWDTVEVLYEFSKFSEVQLFKPRESHAVRSSFYMVASDVQSRSQDALKAITKLQNKWMLATMVLDEDSFRNVLDFQGHDGVEKVLEDFGEEFINLGKGVWTIQATALKNAPFMKDATTARPKFRWDVISKFM